MIQSGIFFYDQYDSDLYCLILRSNVIFFVANKQTYLTSQIKPVKLRKVDVLI